jgi:hypothetical protein
MPMGPVSDGEPHEKLAEVDSESRDLLQSACRNAFAKRPHPRLQRFVNTLASFRTPDSNFRVVEGRVAEQQHLLPLSAQRARAARDARNVPRQ